RRAVIAAASDAAYTTAAALREAGMDVVAIVERRAQAAASTAARGIRIMMGAAVTGVIGRRAVRGCHVQLSAGSRAAGARSERLDCDLILTAGGFAPAVHLHSQAGGRLRWLAEEAMFVPDGAARGLVSVGACAGGVKPGLAQAHATAGGGASARGETAPPPAA